MFRWRKEIEQLDIEARQVYRLYRSLGDIQVALAGLPSQEATAFVCGFKVAEGYRVVVALYLKESARAAFYFPGGASMSREQVGKVMEEGIHFAESMGFMMGDTEFHLLDPAGKSVLWDSMPLRKGGPRPAREVKPQRQAPAPPVAPVAPAKRSEPTEEPDAAVRGKDPVEEAAGEKPRDFAAGRLPSHRKPYAPEEMARRRKKFVKKLGRFLASF